jgi:hypothetical protein
LLLLLPLLGNGNGSPTLYQVKGDVLKAKVAQHTRVARENFITAPPPPASNAKAPTLAPPLDDDDGDGCCCCWVLGAGLLLGLILLTPVALVSRLMRLAVVRVQVLLHPLVFLRLEANLPLTVRKILVLRWPAGSWLLISPPGPWLLMCCC